MAEAQPPAVGGITTEHRTARLNIVNMSGDMTRFGQDTPKLVQAIRDAIDDKMIELVGLSLTKLPNFGADLGFQSIILEGLTDLRETTQTHTRDLLITEPDELFTTLNVGDVAYLSVDQEEAQTMMQINFVGPITERIELAGMDFPDPELSLTAPRIMVMGMLIEKLKIGPGCRSLIVVNMKNLKTIDIEEPGAIEVVRFKNLPSLEHYTDLPETANREGNVFNPPVSAANADLLRASSEGNLEGVRAALAAGADPNAREGDEYRNTAITLTVRSDDNIEVTRALLEAGADPSLTNLGGLTSWEIAEEFESEAIANLLRPRDLSERAAPTAVVLDTVEVSYANQKVFDFEEADEVPIETLLSGDDHLIFKAKNSYFALPRQTIYDGIGDDSQIRFECKKELDGAPYEKDVDIWTSYYYIQGNGNFLVLESELDEALDTYKVCELVETTKILKNVASANSVQITPGINRSGQQVNIVSADHCQAGTPQKVFQLKGVILKGVTKDGKELSSKNLKGLGEHLLAAAEEGELDMVQKLLDKGADINFRGESGETALIAAALMLHLEVIKLLLEKGADKTIKANPGGDFEGMNALETAQEATRVRTENANGPEVVRLLESTGGGKKRAKKQYTFPRKFSWKKCKKTPCKKMGFTQKASCRPFKNCYTRSAGRVSKKRRTYKKKSRN